MWNTVKNALLIYLLFRASRRTSFVTPLNSQRLASALLLGSSSGCEETQAPKTGGGPGDSCTRVEDSSQDSQPVLAKVPKAK